LINDLKTNLTVKGVFKNGNSGIFQELETILNKGITSNDVEGVKSVKNDMPLRKTEKTTVEKVDEFIDDASITAQVKLALTFHRSTSVIKTKVETKDGIVTVSGVAKNSAEKDLVGKLVNDIKGVKEVKNEMTIE
jgi:osmotically-inducible protein OsmY